MVMVSSPRLEQELLLTGDREGTPAFLIIQHAMDSFRSTISSVVVVFLIFKCPKHHTDNIVSGGLVEAAPRYSVSDPTGGDDPHRLHGPFI